MSSSFPSPYSSLPITLVQVDLVSSVHRMLFQNCEGFFRCRWQTLIWPSCFWGSPMVYILWWTLCIHSGEVFSWLWLWHTYTYLLESVLDLANCCEGCFSSPGKEFFGHPPHCFPWSPGLLVLLSSPVRSFFLRMFQTVVLATPNVFAISLMGLFCFFSLMMACFTDSDSSLDLILTVDSNRFQMQIAHLKWTLDPLSAHCNWIMKE